MTSRRDLIKTMTLGMAGLLASERVAHAQPVSAQALLGSRDPLKITRLEIIPVHSLRTIFVKMHTDAGIVGIGEGTVEGRIATVSAAIKELEPYLVGKDPRQPAHHWQAIYRHAFYRGDIVLTSALSAVALAMWDSKGKALGAPVVELHTGAYAYGAEGQLERIRAAAEYGASIGLEVHAGHGLTFDNVKPIAAIREIKELNIGHFLIGEAVFIGLEASIRKMRKLMDEARA